MHDPRSQEEKARAALKRNQEMGTAPKQSPLTLEPSTTKATFGENSGRAPEDIERHQVASETAPEERERAGAPNDPQQKGHGHADTHMTREHATDIGGFERTISGHRVEKK